MWVRQEVRMTPPPKHMRQENSVIIAGFCWDSESEIQPFLTPMSGRSPITQVTSPRQTMETI